MIGSDQSSNDPLAPERWGVLRATCARLRDAAPSLDFAGHRVRLLAIDADRVPPGMEIKPHRHSHHELIWILAGRGRALTEPTGGLVPGTIQLHPRRTLHAWRNGSAPMLRIGLAFELEPETASTPVLPQRWPLQPGLITSLRTLLRVEASDVLGHHDLLRARLVLLMAPALRLLPLVPGRSTPLPPGGPDFTARVEHFLADNLEQGLSLADIALQMRVSVPTLTRRYRSERDCTIMQTLQRLRLETAARLLADGDLSVAEVAARVGFSDCSYFCRCFRSVHGRTPGSVRVAP